MNKTRNIILLIFAIVFSLHVSAQKSIVQKVYAYGFSASFKDSVVYFTEIQEIDSAWVGVKTKFLEGRENYSYQLRDYLADRGMEHRTCIICYSSKLKKTKKKFTKMMDSYSKNGKYDIRLIKEDEFKFKCVEPSETEVYDKNTTITKKKDKKEKKKKGKKIRG